MAEVVKFLRSDGAEIEAEVGSASFELMQKDGGFRQLSAVSGQLSDADEALRVPAAKGTKSKI